MIAHTVYDRTRLVEATIATVEKNLVEGALLVIVVLFLTLGNFRAAIATACVIPLSMLFAITGMVENKVSANLMSLGAIDFGIIIDGAVIIVENCLRLLAAEQHRLGRVLDREERFETILAGSREVIRPSLFGTFIIAVVYLPILTLTGVEGKMFTPMALTVLMALTGASILSLTFVPAAVALLVTGNVSEHENFFMRGARRIYAPLLAASIRNRFGVAVIAALAGRRLRYRRLRMGGEFIPSLDEGDVSMEVVRIPGTSLTQSVEMQAMLEKRLLKVPEVKEVFARTGTAEVATDPMPPSTSDDYVMLKPRKEWPDPDKSKAAVVSEIQEAAEDVPGNVYGILAADPAAHERTRSPASAATSASRYSATIWTCSSSPRRGSRPSCRRCAGAADVKTEQASGLPVLTVKLNRQALSRYGINVADVQNLVEIAVGGKSAGRVFEGDRRFDIVVRLPEHLRSDIEAIRSLPIPLPPIENQAKATPALWGNSPLAQIRYVPLSELAQIDLAPGPNLISREDGKRRIVVTANVRGRDLSSFVADAQQQVDGQGEAAGRLLDRMGRPVRATGLGDAAADDRRAARAVSDLPAALHQPRVDARRAAGVQRRAARADRRRRGAPAARNSALHQRRHRLHRAVRRRRAQRPRHHHVHRKAAPGRTCRSSTRSGKAR